jgi:RND family efflux transporter MFP subunit
MNLSRPIGVEPRAGGVSVRATDAGIWLSKRTLHRLAPLGLAALAVAGALFWFLVPPTVAVVKPVRGGAIQAVYATGSVEPVIMTPIAPRVAGRLVALAVDEGDEIRKGQVLARLESEDLESTIKQLAAQEVFAKAEFERYANLARQGAIAKDVYERAKSDWDSARAATAKARAEAGFMTLVAPGDGRVIRRDGEIGQLLTAGQPLFWLSCNSPLRVSADVDEEDISKVKVGQEVLIRADAFPGKIVAGRVQQITPKGDPIARSYRVRIALPKTSPLLVGMTAETNIIVYRKNDALLVPLSALSGDSVWTVINRRLKRVRISVGTRSLTEAEVRAGLSGHEVIIRNATGSFSDGESVRAVPAPSAP